MPSTTGGSFTAVTIRVIWSVPVSPPLSVTVAVTVWVPAERSDREKDPPVPMDPSRLELHSRSAVRSGSSTSSAVPVNVITSPSANVSPFAGVVIVTVGAWLKDISYSMPSFESSG